MYSNDNDRVINKTRNSKHLSALSGKANEIISKLIHDKHVYLLKENKEEIARKVKDLLFKVPSETENHALIHVIRFELLNYVYVSNLLVVLIGELKPGTSAERKVIFNSYCEAIKMLEKNLAEAQK